MEAENNPQLYSLLALASNDNNNNDALQAAANEVTKLELNGPECAYHGTFRGITFPKLEEICLDGGELNNSLDLLEPYV